MKTIALDLTTEPPRSPRDTSIAGYVVAARALDKCRAAIAGTLGEYKSGCALDNLWLEFAGISYESFRAHVQTGASDAEVSSWIAANARKRTRAELIQWNNEMRFKRISELPAVVQEFLEDYIPKFVPKGRVVYCWFDVYDLEEGRI
jgi:hypothetical protein